MNARLCTLLVLYGLLGFSCSPATTPLLLAQHAAGTVAWLGMITIFAHVWFTEF